LCFPYQHLPRILTPLHPTPHCLLSLSPQNMDEVKHIFTQLVKCVEHLHSKGVVHGDIKTLNLVRTGRPLPAVLNCAVLCCAVLYCAVLYCTVLCLMGTIWLSVPCLAPFCPPFLLSSSLFFSTLSPYNSSSPYPTTPGLTPPPPPPPPPSLNLHSLPATSSTTSSLPGAQWKLIDLDASCVIGIDAVGFKSSSSYVPPEVRTYKECS
jgi:serine/threonine protein kinase